jgi:hypothetical protein
MAAGDDRHGLSLHEDRGKHLPVDLGEHSGVFKVLRYESGELAKMQGRDRDDNLLTS